MEPDDQTFYFESYYFDPETGEALFNYSYGHGLKFTERLKFPAGMTSDLLLSDRILFNLHLILGISYWKAYCPKNISVQSGELTPEQAQFWNTVYTKGLGEFFYNNKIDFRGLVNFPATATQAPSPVPIRTATSSMVLLGGGKDSLVTTGLLRAMKKPVTTMSLGRYPVIETQSANMRVPHVVVERTIDERLLLLNDAGAYNGHIPVSAVYAFTALMNAGLIGQRYIIASNERSANEGNVEYQGEPVNHQWSKSIEFEQMFQQYVRAYITPSITYFSLLRPLSELHIGKLFADLRPEWLQGFTSCNANFAIRKKANKLWCCACPKCAFVFLILAPFIEKKALTGAFGGNPLDDEALIDTYAELLGIRDHKPFECVGTPDEVKVAFLLLKKNKSYLDTAAYKLFESEVLPAIGDEQALMHRILTPSEAHLIPPGFQGFL